MGIRRDVRFECHIRSHITIVDAHEMEQAGIAFTGAAWPGEQVGLVINLHHVAREDGRIFANQFLVAPLTFNQDQTHGAQAIVEAQKNVWLGWL